MQRAASVVLTASLFLALAAYVWRGTYTRYVTDDFCSAHTVHQRGYVEAMKFQRQQWSGRYTYFAIKAALELIGPVTARVTPGILIVLTAVAAAWAIGGRAGMVAGSAIGLAAVDAAPDKFGFYGPVMWETGALTYMLPMILLLVWAGLLLRGRGAVAGAALLFVAGGLSETSVVVQCVLVAGALLFAVRHHDRARMRMAAFGLVASLLALAVVVTAPGNGLRAATAPPRASLIEASTMAVRLANDFIGAHVFVEGAMLLVVTLLGAFAGAQLAGRAQWIETALIAVVAYVISFLPSTWLISAPPPPRALYVSQFLLIVVAFAAGAALRWKIAPAVLLVAALVPLWSAYTTAQVIPAARVDAMHADRIGELLRVRRGQDVVLRSRWALETRYLVNDVAHAANHCICRFYGVRSLRVVR